MISLPCTHCQKVLTIDEAFAGGVCRCQHCGAIQTVPAHLKPGAKGSSGTPPRVLYRNPLRGDLPVGTGLEHLSEQSGSAREERKRRGKRSAAPVAVGAAHHQRLTWRAWAGLCAVVIVGALVIYLLLTRT